MSFQLDPLQSLKEAARCEREERREEQARCEQARREWERRSSVAAVMLWLFVGTVIVGLCKHLLGW